MTGNVQLTGFAFVIKSFLRKPHFSCPKVELQEEGIFFLIQLFAGDILLLKKVGNQRN